MTTSASPVFACVQVNAGTDMEQNLSAAGDLVRRARDAGADLIATPENVSMIVQGRRRIIERARTEAEHPGLPYFCDLARKTDAAILIGSLAIKLDDGRLANRSFLIDPQGRIAARYDKIHMFDVDLPGGESYRESATFRPGEQAVVVPTQWGMLGMTVCYDLRFAHLFRALAQAGAGVIFVPAAFTRQTGEAHWHILLRARAIETGCFIVAPAQTGTHDEGRQTYGHSLIVAPWGEILADAGTDVGFVTARLEMAHVEKARRAIPAWAHQSPFSGPKTVAGAPAIQAVGD